MTGTDRPGHGGMTGATGDLTPDDGAGEFVPAERREISDAEHQGEVTTARGRGAPAQQGDSGAPGESSGAGGAPRDGGVGSGHGLSGADPAYRMETRPDPGVEDRHRRRDADQPRRTSEDGDEFADHEEHF